MILGIDTSCYTTSTALISESGEILRDNRILLQVKPGARGLQQSAAVFQHLQNIPRALNHSLTAPLCAVVATVKPRPAPGSYLPVFQVGASFGEAIANLMKISTSEAALPITNHGLTLSFSGPAVAAERAIESGGSIPNLARRVFNCISKGIIISQKEVISILKKLAIIDGYSLANRAFFVPQFQALATSTGQPTGAVYGFTRMILKFLKDVKPDYLLTAFDVAAPTFRHQEYRDYKGHRLKMEDSLRSQIPIIRELFEILRIPIYEIPGYEADDLIGTFAKLAVKEGLEVEIVTGDRDSFQLVETGIKVLYTRKGISEVDLVDEAYIQARYGLTPIQLIDLKGLMGDPSDNIPGVPGIGEKTALKYLHQFGSLQEIYQQLDKLEKPRERELLETYQEQAILSKRLATIITDIDIPLILADCCRYQEYESQQLIAFFTKYEFSSLIKELTGTEAPVEIRQIAALQYEVNSLSDSELDRLPAEVRAEKCCFIQFLTSEANWNEVKILGIGLGTTKANWFYRTGPGKKPLPEQIVSILTDQQITKIGHDLKKQMLITANQGLSLDGPLEDLLIGGYLITAGQGGLELEALSETYLHQMIPVSRNERGKIYPVFALSDNLADEVLRRITGGRLQALKLLREKFSEFMVSANLSSLYFEVELPLIKVLFQMEKDGIKVDSEVLRSFGNTLRERQLKLETEIYSLVGQEFNISSPKQLATMLFDKLGLKAPKKNKTGYSTDAEVLETLADQHPVVPKILEYRQNIKLQTTYIDSLISLINPQSGRVHTSFNQAVTTTGRLSSTEPNLQNIPVRSEDGRMIRRAFIPERDHYLLAADYSQIELRVMAHFSKDPAFMEAFLKGDDIHRFTAAAVYGVPLEQVTKEMRNSAKAVNFGIIYGISGFGLAKNIGVTRKEAEAFIEAYFSKYPGVKEYVTKLIDAARTTGEARTLLGRIRKLPDLYSRNFTLRSFAERMARNTPIQGTAADIIKLAMVKIYGQLQSKPELGKLLLQVHDELVFEVHQSRWRELLDLAKQEMEGAVTLSVPLVVDFKIGTNWGDMTPVET
jgi:DNA polymerase-1